MTIRILIADDHRAVAEGLRLLLETYPDIEVVGCACNGREALREALKSSPDVVLMDHAMPELNGTEAARLIRQRCPCTNVLMLSVYCDTDHVIRALRAGASGYVTKAADAATVVEGIREVHAGRRFLDTEVADVVLRELVRSEQGDPLDSLSSRERQVLQMLAEGRTMADIALGLSLSRKTVETYRARMMEKLGTRHLAGLVRIAIRHGLVSLD